jgi:hypothetical protein
MAWYLIKHRDNFTFLHTIQPSNPNEVEFTLYIASYFTRPGSELPKMTTVVKNVAERWQEMTVFCLVYVTSINSGILF